MNNAYYDPEEIAHFDTLSADWWNTQGSLRTLHDINPTRLSFIQQYTSLDQQKVLDVGCGGGILSEALAKAGANVTAIDLSAQAINVAIAHAKTQHLIIDYQCTAVETLLDNTARYDVITCMELLEHVPQPEQIIHACAALLNPGGKLFLSTINRTWKAYCFAIVGAEYILNIVPQHTHQYDKFIKPSEIAEWLRHNNMSFDALSGLAYNPCLHQASLTDNVDINYMIVATRKLVGRVGFEPTTN